MLRLLALLSSFLFASAALADNGAPLWGRNTYQDVQTFSAGVGMGTPGTTPATGVLGNEVDSSVAGGSAVALTSTVSANVTSVTLPAGNWLCYAEVVTSPAGSTTTSVIQADINTTSATLSTAPNDGAGISLPISLGAGVAAKVPVGQRIYRSATSQTVYLVANVTFAVSTLGAYGYLGCTQQP